MTKYEWESELKKNIHRMPDDEIKRVLDYYAELFEDNIERGKSEREIIREFGNPSDVAYKIMSEYDGELKSEDVFDTPPKKSSSKIEVFDTEEKHAESVFAGHTDIGNRGAATISLEDRSENGIDNRSVKIMIFIVVNIVTGFAPLWIAFTLWIVLCSFVIAGVSLVLGGVAALAVSFGPTFTGMFGSGLSQIGISLALIGIGLAITVLFSYTIKKYAAFTVRCFKSFFGNKE